MGEGIVAVLILLPIRTATRLEDNTLALAMAVRHFAQVGLSELLAGPRLRADHGQTGRNWITSCLPTTPTLIPRVWIAGSNQSGVDAHWLLAQASYRYSVGLAPQIRRNTRAKCCCVLKPQATATSRTRASGARNISFARSILLRNTNWCGVSPVDLRNTAATAGIASLRYARRGRDHADG